MSLGKGGGAPAAPDPVATAAAQTLSNQETARTNAELNRVNQYTPDGSIEFNRAMTPAGQHVTVTPARPAGYNPTTGEWLEATGETRTVNTEPVLGDRWESRTTLSPANQRLYDQRQTGLGIYADAALNQMGIARDRLATPLNADPYNAQAQRASKGAEGAFNRAVTMAGQPVNTDYNAIRQQAIDAARVRADPRFAQEEESLRARLLASGAAPGSAMYNNEFRGFREGRNDAYSQIDLNAGQYANQAIDQTAALRQIPIGEASQIGQLAGNLSNLAGQRIQQEIAPRNQALNEAAAMLTGQQITTPQMQPIPQAPVANTDVIGATMGAANINAQNHAAQQQANSAAWGGLLGLGGTLGGAAILSSDERLKTDIDRVGKTDDGTPIYTYRMKDDPSGATRMGVMAQELRRKKPDAVHRMPGGFFGVDYSKVS